MSKRCKLDFSDDTSMSHNRLPKCPEVGGSSVDRSENEDKLPKALEQGCGIPSEQRIPHHDPSNGNYHEFVHLPSPVKAPTDKKEYSLIQLKNGLKALLISDVPNLINLDDLSSSSASSSESESDESESASVPDSVDTTESDNSVLTKCSKEEKMAACALTVGVGSFSDPEEIPGLAHFLEHMVFMGSKKYPKENEFDAFIKRKGGSDNASTECEYTTFYFECNDQHLHRGMDMFAHFFISPLMKREAMTREREAIESEFQMSLPSDTYRREQLLGSTADPANPVGKFMWGNLITLRDNVSDDILHKTVHEFWERHYSAHRMTVAVQSRLPMKVLEKWVSECFSDVPSNKLPPLEINNPTSMFLKNKFCKIYYIEPVNDICQIEISWCLPPLRPLYKCKPGDYISWLIGHEGKGSLICYLRSKLWALDITTSHGDDGFTQNSYFSVFSVSINLTEDGYTNISSVLKAIFSYIKLVSKHGPQQRLFDEIKCIEDINFQFAEEEVPVEYVESLSEEMQFYPSEHIITGPNLFFEYNPSEISRILEYLIPSQCNIMISSKKVPKDHNLDQEEKWFKTRFTSEPIKEELLQSLEGVEPYSEFHLPEPNLFIPTDFKILPDPQQVLKYPQKIKSTELIEIFYKQDTKFKLPQAMIYCNIMTDIAHKCAKNACLQDVFILSLKHLLTEEVYPANMAQLEYSLSSSEKGLQITFTGFNQKLELLVESILRQIVNFSDDITDGIFQAYKKLMLRQYLNSCLRPEFLARDIRMKILMKKIWTTVEKYNALQTATLDDLKDFCSKAYENVFIQCLIQGNLSLDQTLEISEKIASTLNCKPLSPERIPETRVCQILTGESTCRVKSFNSNDSNCVTTNYFQLGPGKIKEYCLIEVLLMLMEERLFDTLRTQEQLGYDVSCTLRDTFGILGFSVTVVSQAAKHTVDHVETRIANFLKTLIHNLENLPDGEFEDVISSLIKLKKCGDVHLKEEVKRNWEEIKSCEYVFDRLEKEIEIISQISLEEVIEFLKSQIGLNGPNHKRKLTLQVVGNDKHNNKAQDIEGECTSSHQEKLDFEIICESSENPSIHFVKDLYSYNKDLIVFPVNKVT